MADFKPLGVRDDPDWVDLQFWITRHQITEMAGEPWLGIGVAARHAGRDIGFKVLYPLQWQLDEGGVRPHNLAAALYVLDAPPYSDALMQCLAALWKVEAPARMAAATVLWASHYGGDPERVLEDEIMLYAWVGDPQNPRNPEKPFGELHIVVDVPGGRFKLCEREPDCVELRRAILMALARGGG